MSDARALAVAGLTRLSTTDWPGQIVATVFTQGCPLACTYCHNPSLIDPRTPAAMAWDDVVSFLAGRVGLLDGVVFSGGEPTLQPQLPDAVAQVKAMGFKVGLHTSGVWPARVQTLLADVDWVGLDLKATASGYRSLTGSPVAGARARATLALLADAGVPFEVRTTVVPGTHTAADVLELHREVRAVGATHVLQKVRTIGTSDAFTNSRPALTFEDVVPDGTLPDALRRG